MPLINFKLRAVADIDRWASMGWFALSDGEYWFNLGKVNFYEYTEDRLTTSGVEGRKFANYQLARLTEDCTCLFEYISESIPDELYSIVKEASTFFALYNAISEKINEKIDENLIDEEFDRIWELQKWIHNRYLGAMHLQYGPHMFFFRCKDKISLVWDATDQANGANVWTAGKGNIEMDYESFVNEVTAFKDLLFDAMDKQIHMANAMDWGNFVINRERNITEQWERKNEFGQQLKFLTGHAAHAVTDWKLVCELRKELSV